MVTSRRSLRFAENRKEVYRNKKKHPKGVESFCFAHLVREIRGVVAAVASQILHSLLKL